MGKQAGKRVTVYVRNDLWEQAERHQPANSPSALVQAALQQMVDQDRNRTGVAAQLLGDDADESAKAVSEVQRRMLREARAEYELGVSAGAKIAAVMSWRNLSWLFREESFDYWLQGLEVFSDADEFPDSAEECTRILEQVIEATGWDWRRAAPGGLNVFGRGPTFLRGVEDALAHIHSSINAELPTILGGSKAVE